MEQDTTIRIRIEQALAVCRPFLQTDGGDVELISITRDGIVKLKYQGTCVHCPMSGMTLRAGIERTIMQHAPGVKRVEAVTQA